jgi:hypothetical protein
MEFLLSVVSMVMSALTWVAARPRLFGRAVVLTYNFVSRT